MSQIDDILGFDPSQLSVFNEPKSNSFVDPAIYKPNPKFATSEDGVYRSKVRIILNPLSPKDTIVPQAQYWLRSVDGSRPVFSSLSIGDKNCPIFKAWKSLWYSDDEEKKERSREIFQKNETQWVLVQILEDKNQPELVGKFKVMKLAKDIYTKMVDLMNPSAESGKTPYPVADYVVGLELSLVVQPGPDDPKAPERKQREISYTLSSFGSYAPVIKTDGTPSSRTMRLSLWMLMSRPRTTPYLVRRPRSVMKVLPSSLSSSHSSVPSTKRLLSTSRKTFVMTTGTSSTFRRSAAIPPGTKKRPSS